MSNVFEEVGHGIKVAAVDTEHVIVDAVEFLPKAEKVIASAIKAQPAIKTAVLELVKQASGVIGDTATAAAAKGINLTEDAKALADAESFFTYFKSTFIPLVESVYHEIAADVQ